MSFFEEGVVVLGSYESNLLLGRFCVLLVACGVSVSEMRLDEDG